MRTPGYFFGRRLNDFRLEQVFHYSVVGLVRWTLVRLVLSSDRYLDKFLFVCLFRFRLVEFRLVGLRTKVGPHRCALRAHAHILHDRFIC